MKHTKNSLQNGCSFQSSHQRLNLHNFTKCSSQSLELVTIVIIINVVFGKFCEKDLTWLAHVTVQLQVSNYSQLSDYTVRIIRVKYSSLCIVHICGNCKLLLLPLFNLFVCLHDQGIRTIRYNRLHNMSASPTHTLLWLNWTSRMVALHLYPQ